MLSHTFSLATYDDGNLSLSLTPTFVWATRGLNFAHYAVAVFIVLSGFCLMLPVAGGGAPAGRLVGICKATSTTHLASLLRGTGDRAWHSVCFPSPCEARKRRVGGYVSGKYCIPFSVDPQPFFKV